jgi:hypothetical protein
MFTNSALSGPACSYLSYVGAGVNCGDCDPDAGEACDTVPGYFYFCYVP